MHRLAKPTNGHPTQKAAILALHADGIAEPEIAAKLEVAINTVRARIYEAGRAPNQGRATTKREFRPRAHQANGRARVRRLVSTIDLNHDVSRQLRPFAAVRATNVMQVAREIVEAAVERGLVDSLLDGRF